MADPQQIYTLIPLVAQAIGTVGKEKRNQQQNYNFRSIDDVIDACHAAFVKHRLFLVTEVLDAKREERQTKSGTTLLYSIVRMRFTFYAPDGSHVASVCDGEGMDSGDKATNKAMSAALKYALGQTFLIPFSAQDSEADSPAPAPRTAPQASAPAPRKAEGETRGITCGFDDKKKPVCKPAAAMTASELSRALELADATLDNPAREKYHKYASRDRDAIMAEMAERQATGKPDGEPPF